MSSMPTYPSGSERMPDQGFTPRLATPADVQTSVKLWFASIAVGLVGGILAYGLTDQTAAVAEMSEAGASGLTQAQLEMAVTVGLVVALVISLTMLGLQVLFVLKMKAGRNWARIVLTVLGGLSVLSALIGLTQDFTMGSAFSLVSLGLLVAAVIKMYRPATAAYFHQPKA